jgi:DNA-binding transcriptional LysR family regulator
MQDWDTLRYILAISRHGSLSAAARALGSTHATLARQLTKAEANAGVRLFSRRPSGLEPTEAGQDAIASARRIESEILALDTDFAARGGETAGPVTITVPPLIASSGVAQDLARFAQSNPDIRLTVLASDTPLDLHRREADIAIRVSHDPPQSLWGKIVTKQTAGWFATQDYLTKHAEALTSGAQDLPILSFTSWPQPVPASLLQHLSNARSKMTCDDMPTAAALAETGAVMLRMPFFLTQKYPKLLPVPQLPTLDYMPIWCLTHPDLRAVPRMRSVMQTVAQGFSRRRVLYSGGVG